MRFATRSCRPACRKISLPVLLLLAAAVICGSLSGQSISDARKRLILPRDLEKPDLPLSSGKYFEELPQDCAVIEVLLHEDGSILGFEKRTLQDLEAGTAHARTIRDEGHMHHIFRYGVSLAGNRVIKSAGRTTTMPDIDFVIYTSGETPLFRLTHLMAIARDVDIYRFYIGARDRETRMEGLVPCFLHCHPVSKEGLPERKRLANMHSVELWYTADSLKYDFGRLGHRGSANPFRTLSELEECIDELRDINDEAKFCLMPSHPIDFPDDRCPARVRHLVDLMTLLASKGGDLKSLEAPVELLGMPGQGETARRLYVRNRVYIEAPASSLCEEIDFSSNDCLTIHINRKDYCLVTVNRRGGLRNFGRVDDSIDPIRGLLSAMAKRFDREKDDKASTMSVLIRADRDAGFRSIQKLMQICGHQDVFVYKIIFGCNLAMPVMGSGKEKRLCLSQKPPEGGIRVYLARESLEEIRSVEITMLHEKNSETGFRLTVNGKALSGAGMMDEFSRLMKKVNEQMPEARPLFFPDRKIRYGQVIDLLTRCRRAGFSEFSFGGVPLDD